MSVETWLKKHLHLASAKRPKKKRTTKAERKAAHALAAKHAKLHHEATRK